MGISRLAGYTEFSEQQASELLDAAVENSQIAWISGDRDVAQFFRILYEAHPTLLGGYRLERFRQLYGHDLSGEDPLGT